ncbi:MAG: polyphosphate kinase 1 [Methylococcales bacterium]|nr:polyphosphate kinase 1 [Methylococcales bacterium]
MSEATSTTPLNAVPPDTPEWYLNRELTWLAFNERVLYQAEDLRTPLLERLKFIAIVSANLDEFFMKRIGALKQQVGAGISELSVDGRSAQQQITECCQQVRTLEAHKQVLLTQVMAALAEHGIAIRQFTDLPEAQRKKLSQFYSDNIYPLITPQAIDPAHPFPFVSNLSLNLLVGVKAKDGGTLTLVRMKVPTSEHTPRFVPVTPGASTFVTLDDLIANHLSSIFPELEIVFCERFRVTRNAITEKDEDQADDLLEMIESELRERKFAPLVRLEVSAGMHAMQCGMLAAELGLDEVQDVFTVDSLMAMRDLFQLAGLDHPTLQDLPHHPCDHPQLAAEPNIFHAIRKQGTILLQHPYESFVNSVERFVREASRDPQVQAIKMTLYRTSEGTKIVDYLMEAAINGKQVAVVVELKARFDESANIRWAQRMERVGIHVTYGVVGLKTHCKIVYVVRQDYNGLRRYAHIGTGNYHAGTARLYSDLGILTDDADIGADLTELFNYLTTGLVPKRNYKLLLVAPNSLKSGLLQRIEREIKRHQNHGDGLIQFKMNALEDKDITRALYRAAQVGVHVDLIIRDTCRLRPGITGLSESVKVISIVGRFLEHTRIYYFHHGGEDEYFMGSADSMKRNLERRVEVLTPVRPVELKAQLRTFIDTQLHDQRSVWDMLEDGSYRQRQAQDNAPGAQERLIEQARLREQQNPNHDYLKKRKKRKHRHLH